MLNDSDEFMSFFVLHRFKRFKTKLISYIDISSDENNKFSSSFNESQFSAKNVNFRRNDSIIVRSNFKKFIKDQNQIENIIDKYVISIQLDNDYNQIDENEKSIKIKIFDFDKL